MGSEALDEVPGLTTAWTTTNPADRGFQGPDGGGALAVWLAFSVAVPLSLALDTMCLTEKHRGEVSMSAATSQCVFWILAGLSFNLFIWYWLGSPEAVSWLSGYVLEYMLSIDNLFCFHLIFTSYKTPKDQTNRALSYGIGGAAVLRLLLFAVGASAFNFTFLVHWLFGAVLLWSGFKVMMMEEENDVDHTENWLVKLVSQVLPIEQSYCEQAYLFVDVPVDTAGSSEGKSRTLSLQARRSPFRDSEGESGVPSSFGKALQEPQAGDPEEDPSELEGLGGSANVCSSSSSSSPMRRREERQLQLLQKQQQEELQKQEAQQQQQQQKQLQQGRTEGDAELDLLLKTSAPEEGGSPVHPRRTVRKATLLFLVVITLGAVDLIFALDSVAAKVAMVTQFDDRVDLALNFTSSAFTMLTLRSLYFMLASLVHIFRLMKYGVGVILILIGLRLILQSYMPLSEGGFCFVMLSIFAVSIIASLLLPAPAQASGSSTSTELGYVV